MRFPVLPALIRVLIFAGIVVGAHSALAQTGTLQAPTKPQVDKPVPPPSPAPRQPVRRDGRGSDTPVVRAQGVIDAQRPPGRQALPLPPPPPPPPPPERAGTPAAESAHPTPSEAEKKEAPTSKLPRFAALRTDEVNMRAGPGTRYPIEWVYRRRDLPVEIEREFEVWRLVRDQEGIRGWIHQATLTGRRTFMVKGGDATLRTEAKDTGSAVAVLQAGVIGRLRSCEAGSNWCQVQAASHHGYLRRDQIWGVLPGEIVTP